MNRPSISASVNAILQDDDSPRRGTTNQIREDDCPVHSKQTTDGAFSKKLQKMRGLL